MADIKKVYVFFGDKERMELEATGYEIVEIVETPCIKGHGGDIIVTCRKKSSFELLQQGQSFIGATFES